jgi:TRAP-type C4-dicarboxylate transport system substrate-binding protein
MRVANGEGPGSPESKAVLFFADEVARASGGTVKVEPLDDEQADADNDKRVVSGEIDAAITQARSWDALGVTSLQALQTPFLITNEATAAAATDGDIASRLMSGLTAKGVDGLALWAIDFRHPVSFGEPFLSPADFKGTKIRIVGSTITEEVMRALGADPVRPEGEWLELIENGTIQGAETAFDRVSTLPKIGTMTGNVTFYPRVDAFFINHATFSRLSPAQQDAVRTAAAATRQHVIDGIVPDADQAASYCAANGGTVVIATETDLAAMATALQSVRTTLESDSLTKQLIANISAVASGVKAPPATVACEPPPPDILQGTWHTKPVTEAQVVTAFVAAGGPETDGREFFANYGGGATKSAVIGLGFDRGSLTLYEAGDSGKDVRGDLLGYDLAADGTLTTHGSDGCLATFATTLVGDTLRMTALKGCPGQHDWPYALTLLTTFPFRRDAAASVPDGTYTTIATKADATKAPWDDECALMRDGAHITLELKAGNWTESESCEGQPISVGSRGTYTSTAAAFVLTDCCDGSSSTFAWTLEGTKLTLMLTGVTGGEASTERVIRFIFEHDFERAS